MKTGGVLVAADLASTAELLSSFFDSKQSRVANNLPHTCYPEPKLSSFAFKSRAVHKLHYRNYYGGVDPLRFLFCSSFSGRLLPFYPI